MQATLVSQKGKGEDTRMFVTLQKTLKMDESYFNRYFTSLEKLLHIELIDCSFK